MTPNQRRTVQMVARVLNEACSPQTVAGIIDNLLVVDEVRALGHDDVCFGQELHYLLCQLNPQAVAIAQQT